MINFKTENGIFNFRVAGILFHENKVLIHRLVNDNFYAFPGGRVELFEDTENTIIREMREELDIDIEIRRLLWIGEHFFIHNDNKYHEICFYYLIECDDKKFLDRGDLFFVTENEIQFEFKWIPVTEIENETLYPIFIKKRLSNLPISIERIVDIDE